MTSLSVFPNAKPGSTIHQQCASPTPFDLLFQDLASSLLKLFPSHPVLSRRSQPNQPNRRSIPAAIIAAAVAVVGGVIAITLPTFPHFHARGFGKNQEREREKAGTPVLPATAPKAREWGM